MKLSKIHDEEVLTEDVNNLRSWQWQRQILETDRRNTMEELEDLVSEYIADHKELILKEVDVLRNLIEFAKSNK